MRYRARYINHGVGESYQCEHALILVFKSDGWYSNVLIDVIWSRGGSPWIGDPMPIAEQITTSSEEMVSTRLILRLQCQYDSDPLV
jgi:hypothetical protein